MKGRSLRADLTRASLSTTLLALLLTAGALLLYELATYRAAWVADLRSQADLIARSTAAALVFDDPKAAHENLVLLKQQPRIRAAAILDARGRPFATYQAADEAPPAPQGLELPGAHDQRFDGSVLEVTHPIEHDEQVLGTVYLRAEHDTWAKVGNYAAILAVVTLGSLLLAYIVFGRLQGAVTRPLLQMTAVAREVMARRDFRLRAPPTRNTDIAVLVSAFNGMLSEVEASTEELERSNRRLGREMVERQQAEEGLRLADRRKDEFLATLAHELRNPLAPMMNAVALVRMPNATPAMREKSALILDRQLRHMVRLIDDLMDISRIATGKLSLRTEMLDLAALLRGAAEVAEPGVRERGQSLSLEVPDEPCWLHGDPARLSQVFANLLSNACRYTGEGGRIRLAMALAAGRVEVAVCDTGVGIEPGMQQRIFELFEQADKSLERGNAGLGIGLTLARQLVRLHGGDITVASEGLGRGAVFTVTLPRPAAAATVAEPDAGRAATSPAAPLKILVADDNRDFASSLAQMLTMLGHQVRVVNEGTAALQAAVHEPPEVALLDIGMPGCNGYEVARRLRAQPQTASIRLIAITGWGQAADRQAAAQAGFDHHLVKPVGLDDLLALLPSGA